MIEKYNLINLKTVKSTNIEIKKLFLLNKKISNLCLSADNQTAGYGRRNTKWFSYPGNLHLSILLKPRCNLEVVNQLSFLTSISIGETLKKKRENINIKYKWPNDILLNKKKIAGILIETSSYLKNKIKWVIIGIGLNLINFPELKENNFKASSLKKEKILIEKDVFTDLFLKIFFKNYSLWKKKGFNFVKNKWMSNIYKKNNNITIKHQNNYVKGKLINLLINGGIKLEIRNKTKVFFYGDQVL